MSITSALSSSMITKLPEGQDLLREEGELDVANDKSRVPKTHLEDRAAMSRIAEPPSIIVIPLFIDHGRKAAFQGRPGESFPTNRKRRGDQQNLESLPGSSMSCLPIIVHANLQPITTIDGNVNSTVLGHQGNSAFQTWLADDDHPVIASPNSREQSSGLQGMRESGISSIHFNGHPASDEESSQLNEAECSGHSDESVDTDLIVLMKLVDKAESMLKEARATRHSMMSMLAKQSPESFIMNEDNHVPEGLSYPTLIYAERTAAEGLN